jgi:transcriptional regulator with PAS, ATPase and Fis domain
MDKDLVIGKITDSKGEILTNTLKELMDKFEGKIGWSEIIWEGLHAYCFYKDTNNIMIRVNKNLANEMGLKPEDIEGKSMSTFGWSNELVQKYFDNDLDVIHSGRPKLNIREMFGNQKVVTNKFPIFNSEQKVIGILGISLRI